MKNFNPLLGRTDSIILPEDLVAIDKTLREAVDLEAMIARQVAPMRTGDHPGTERIEFQKVTREGAAKIFNMGGADNVPTVDLHTTPTSQRVVSLVIGFTVNAAERRAANMAGADLTGQKTITSQRLVTVKENDLFFNGSTPHNMEGLLNFTGIQTFTVPLNGGGTSRTWTNKTAAERLKDIMLSWAKIQLKDAYRATMAIFNTTDTQYLHEPYSSTSPESVWEIVQRRGWFPAGMLTSEKIPSGTFVVMQNTRDVLEYALPMDLYTYPPYRLNAMTEEVDFEERFGGVVVYRPLGICVVTGIA